MAVDDEDVIDHAVVKIGVDTKGLHKEAQLKVNKELAGVKGKIPVELDYEGADTQRARNAVASMQFKYFQQQAARQAAQQKRMDGLQRQAFVQTRQRARTFNEELIREQDRADATNLRRTRSTSELKQHLLVAGEQAAHREMEAVRRREQASQERAARQESRLLDQRRRSLSKARRAPQLIDFGGEGFKPLNLLYASITALTPALFAMSASALQASTSVAALGSAGIGASLAITGLALSFGSIVDILKLQKTVDNEKMVRSAKDAATSADDAARRQRDIANAIRDEKDAYAGIHKARQEAIRDLEDLRRAVRDLDNQYKSDRISVAEAVRDEKATNANFFATALDRARAHQNTLDARTRLQDTALERKQKRQDLGKSLQAGIEGSDKVRDAREKARDARDRRLDAQATKTSQATAGITSAQEQLNKRLKDASPAARDFATYLKANEERFKSLRRTVEQGTLPGFFTGLKAIMEPPKGGKSTLQLAAEYAAELGGIIGKYAGKFGAWTRSPLFRKDMAIIQKNNATALDKLGEAAQTAMKPILTIITAASPLLVKFSDKLIDVADEFDKWIAKADKSGALQQWFEDAATQAGLWWDVLKNIGTLLRNLFTGSLPAGGGLMERFRDFTGELAKWSSSSAGQDQIRKFFEVFQKLPYAQIRDFFIQAGELFVGMRAFNWAKANPFWAAMAVFATSNPAMATEFLKVLTYAMEQVTGFVAANPELTTLILGLVSLAKLNKAGGGILFKLGGLEKLTETLRGKFKVLDTLLGGGTKTGVMAVQAGVVNVYGGAGVPGLPGKGAPGKGGAPAALGGGLVGGLTVAAVLAAIFSSQQWKRARAGEGFFDPFTEFAKDPSLKNALNTLQMASPVGIAAYGLGKLFEKKKVTAQTTEADRFFDLQADVVKYGYQPGMAANDSTVSRRDAVQQYIDARKKSVALLVEEAQKTKGDTAAKALNLAETKKSAGALSTMLQQYGWTKDKADAYGRAVYDLNGLLVQQKREAYLAKAAVDAHGKSMTAAGKKAEETTPKIHMLNQEIDKVSGEKKITFTTDGKEKVQTDLEGLAAYQQLLRQGKAPTEANLKKQKAIFGKNFAGGGPVKGYSPSPTADNIPAWLTAREYVQPVSSVKYYGTDFMEAVRTRRFPRFAKGGQAPDAWPFPVKVPAEAGKMEAEAGMGWAPYAGKAPKGVGAIKGVNAKMALAAIDAHSATGAYVSSGLRPGAITVTGNKSYHGYGRAIDLVPPSMALFTYLKNKYDGAIKELIYSPAGNKQVWNGKPHMYTGAVRATHWDHVHLAMAQGGQVPARKYDSGGVLPPGYSLAFNGTGRPETIRTAQQERRLNGPVRLDRRDLALLAGAVTSGGASIVNMDGRRVAELTNRYNYLPSGV